MESNIRNAKVLINLKEKLKKRWLKQFSRKIDTVFFIWCAHVCEAEDNFFFFFAPTNLLLVVVWMRHLFYYRIT